MKKKKVVCNSHLISKISSMLQLVSEECFLNAKVLAALKAFKWKVLVQRFKIFVVVKDGEAK